MATQAHLQTTASERPLRATLVQHARILGGIVALLWAIELVDRLVLSGWLDQFGVRPRDLVGLRGIVLSPLLHGGFDHLAANTLSLVILGWFILLRGVKQFWLVTAITAVVGGLGVWLIGAGNSVHIGASGVIFGYLGYLLARGLFERKLASILGSVAIAILYGGMLFGVLPGEAGISWEGHLFGFLGGVLAARLLSSRARSA